MFTEAQALEALKGVIDPDVGINIVDLGMIENIAIAAEGVMVDLIMTTPACPQTAYLSDECQRLLTEAGAPAVSVEVLELPLWDPSRLSDSARAQLGW